MKTLAILEQNKPMPSELQWITLCNLINGLSQIDWYVNKIETEENFLYIHIRSIIFAENTFLFIINNEGDFV